MEIVAFKYHEWLRKSREYPKLRENQLNTSKERKHFTAEKAEDAEKKKVFLRLNGYASCPNPKIKLR